ncbi:hypothetical protein CAEBREN_22560 [Caenorhabditis brenneri]|uniref:DUF38 domain-containing protein n=1 Tax=Caenorhabditis brenneri TaxID=135651 RepID=G0N1L3_CAEBE|nr:hypothetical protein CAEBREN_22560 [Caenorhabditis brenneri]
MENPEMENQEVEHRVPVWEDLPLTFKISVVKELGYKDRCCLRKCSYQDMLAVDATPNHLHEVAINTFEHYSLLSFSDQENTVYAIRYNKNLREAGAKFEFTIAPKVYIPGKNEKLESKKVLNREPFPADFNDMDLVLVDFWILLKKLHCEKLHLNGVIMKDWHPMAHPEKTLEFRARLLEMLTDPEVVKIKTKALSLHWHQEQDEILQILQKLDANTLKSLEFSDRNATWEVDQIVETDQWRRSEKVLLELLTTFNVEAYVHFSEIQMHVRNLEEQELWRLIQIFIAKNLHGSSFHFTYRVDEPDLQRILDTFDVEAKNEPIHAQTQLRSVLGGRFIHTQRFKMPSPDLVLVLMISEKEVMGTVCHKDQVDVEAKVERGLLR